MTAATVIGPALRALELATAPERMGDGRTVAVRLVSYNVAARVSDDNGRSFYDETFAPNSVRVETDAPVYREVPRTGDPHNDRPVLVGRIVSYRSTADGCYADVRVADTAAGRDLLAELDDRVIRHVSIEFDAPTVPPSGRATGPVTHTAALVRGLLFTNSPQSPGADVLGRRSQVGVTTMPDVAGNFTGTIEGQIDDPEPSADETAEQVEATPPAPPAAGRARPTPSVRQLATLPAAPAPGLVPPRFRSFGEFVHACSYGSQRVSREERELVFRALDRATLLDVTGLLQTSWSSEILDLYRAYTPVVDSFTTRPLPDKGMVIGYPTVTVRPLVGVQPSDGGLLPSRAVEVTSGSMTVGVYGGGQEMTIGTIQRTDPAYLDLVLRLYVIEMAKNLEAAITTAVVAAADDINTVPIEMGATDALIQDAFVDASVPFLTNLNRLPDFALINTVLWQRMAKAKDTTGRPLYPGVSPVNPVGHVDLTDVNGNVRGLDFRVAPGIGGATSVAVVGVKEAFVAMLGPIQTLQADVPETLVHQMAVFQFAAFGVMDATGLVKIVDAV